MRRLKKAHRKIFEDEYFGLRYPLPAGWEDDLKGPETSATGYYSLAR